MQSHVWETISSCGNSSLLFPFTSNYLSKYITQFFFISVLLQIRLLLAKSALHDIAQQAMFQIFCPIQIVWIPPLLPCPIWVSFSRCAFSLSNPCETSIIGSSRYGAQQQASCLTHPLAILLWLGGGSCADRQAKLLLLLLHQLLLLLEILRLDLRLDFGQQLERALHNAGSDQRASGRRRRQRLLSSDHSRATRSGGDHFSLRSNISKRRKNVHSHKKWLGGWC